MRTIFFMAALTMLTACNGGSGNKTVEKCQYNGVDVSCKELRARETANDVRTTQMAVSTVSSPIRVDEVRKEIDILANDYDVRTFTDSAGNEIECETSLTAGEKYEYVIVGNNLKLSKNGETVSLTRVSRASTGLSGEWSIFDRELGMQSNFIFENNTRLTVTTYCLP